MIPLAKPYIRSEEKRAVKEVLESGMLAQGQKVAEFEEKFAHYIGVKYAVATASGTTALHTALLSLSIGPGDEVITTPFSFIATADAILYSGAKPVFVDIDPITFNIDTKQIESKITSKTKAILPVHLYGLPAAMPEILKIAKNHKLKVIEDAAQSHGASIKNTKTGAFGDVGCFSFYATKNMTSGEGGMLTTNNVGIAEKARMIRAHGSKIKYVHEILGYNYAMNNIEAAIGVEQLKKLDKFNKVRVRNARLLTVLLSNINDIVTPTIDPFYSHVFHQYTVKVPKKLRDNLMKYLIDKGVGAGIHYPIPIHKQKIYKKMYPQLKMPNAESASSQVLSLPIHQQVTAKDIKLISTHIHEFFKK